MVFHYIPEDSVRHLSPIKATAFLVSSKLKLSIKILKTPSFSNISAISSRFLASTIILNRGYLLLKKL
jgi:hypothetical protein